MDLDAKSDGWWRGMVEKDGREGWWRGIVDKDGGEGWDASEGWWRRGGGQGWHP